MPDDIAVRLVPEARRVPDTDWHVSRLYAFARELGASILVPRYSRYVVDLNRPPDDTSLYPGQNTTGLCPLVTFDNQPLYPGATELSLATAEWVAFYNRQRPNGYCQDLTPDRAEALYYHRLQHPQTEEALT